MSCCIADIVIFFFVFVGVSVYSAGLSVIVCILPPYSLMALSRMFSANWDEEQKRSAKDTVSRLIPKDFASFVIFPYGTTISSLCFLYAIIFFRIFVVSNDFGQCPIDFGYKGTQYWVIQSRGTPNILCLSIVKLCFITDYERVKHQRAEAKIGCNPERTCPNGRCIREHRSKLGVWKENSCNQAPNITYSNYTTHGHRMQ